MQKGSLKLRLFAAAAILISIVILLAGFAFQYLFERYVEKLTAFELNNHFIQLAGKISRDANGEIVLTAPLSDPRFLKPYGGLYWQIDVTDKPSLRSRSLWDDELNVTKSIDQSPQSFRAAAGPHGEALLLSEHTVSVAKPDGTDQKLRVAVGIDYNQIASAVTSFSKDLMLGLGALYVILLIGSFLQIAVGLKPLERLRSNIARIRQGTAQNIDNIFPNEVQPLVEEVNALLTARDQQLVRARDRASNMAHGLKTPLTVMTAIAESMEEKGEKTNAEIIRRSAKQMHDLVERELARARLASGHAPKLAALLPVVNRVAESFQRTSHGTPLWWQIAIAPDQKIAIESGDLLELLGNLMDNAQKWAKSTVYVSYRDHVLAIEDDGPGVPEPQMVSIQNRGVKLDETKPGSGLGLSIVRDIAELYSMTVQLTKSNHGGLKVSISPTQV